MLDGKERIDRVDDARSRAGNQGDRCLYSVGQDIGHDILGADPQLAKQVCGADDIAAKLGPGEGTDGIRGTGCELKGQGRAVGKGCCRSTQLFEERPGRPAVGKRHFRLGAHFVCKLAALDVHCCLPDADMSEPSASGNNDRLRLASQQRNGAAQAAPSVN